MGFLKSLLSKLATLVLVLAAALAAHHVYNRWVDEPWTRDGQVRADVIKIAPRVMGYVVKVAVKDNQFVRKGELLFKIDPSSFQLSVDAAQVELDQAREEVAALEASVKAAEAMVEESEAGVIAASAMIKQQQAALANAMTESTRAKHLEEKGAGSVERAEQKVANVLELQAEVESARADYTESEAAVVSSMANLEQAKATLGETGDANVRIRDAMVTLEEARLKLSWTTMNAPSDGYITNLDVSEGTFGFTGIPIAAFVDSTTFRVDGYFQETKLKHIKPGDEAIITLMSHPDIELKGVVDSIGYAINPPSIADTEGVSYLVPQIEPTFDWVRLPQRVPVRIRFKEVPKDIQLISGMTASVAIRPSRKD